MPGFLLTAGMVGQCPHPPGQVMIASSARVLVLGQPVATVADTTQVTGCTFNVSGSPHPCVTVRWSAPAQRVLINRQPALLDTSPGTCQSADQAPQGAALVTPPQTKVRGM